MFVKCITGVKYLVKLLTFSPAEFKNTKVALKYCKFGLADI